MNQLVQAVLGMVLLTLMFCAGIEVADLHRRAITQNVLQDCLTHHQHGC